MFTQAWKIRDTFFELANETTSSDRSRSPLTGLHVTGMVMDIIDASNMVFQAIYDAANHVTWVEVPSAVGNFWWPSNSSMKKSLRMARRRNGQ